MTAEDEIRTEFAKLATAGPASAEPGHETGRCDFCHGTIHRGTDRYGCWFCCDACASAWNRRQEHSHATDAEADTCPACFPG
jgi:hypothetical protein